MSEQHTPEPWRAEKMDGAVYVFSPNYGLSVCRMTDKTIDGQFQNARRIVACVNACAGMTDPESELARLCRINERLVEALKSVGKTTEVMAFQPKSEESSGGDFVFAYDWFCDESRNIDEQIRQALAAAKEE